MSRNRRRCRSDKKQPPLALSSQEPGTRQPAPPRQFPRQRLWLHPGRPPVRPPRSRPRLPPPQPIRRCRRPPYPDARQYGNARANQPPELLEGASTERFVRAGILNSKVGLPVFAQDPDGDPVSYSRDSEDVGRFVLHVQSWQPWTSRSLPEEGEEFYLRIWAKDGRGRADYIDVRILTKAEAEPTETPSATPVPAPTEMPTPTPVAPQAQTELATPTPKPTATPTTTLTPGPTATPAATPAATPKSVQAEERPSHTPAPTTLAVDQEPPTPQQAVVLAQSGKIPTPTPWWPRAFIWLGNFLLLFALAWTVLLAARDRLGENRIANIGSKGRLGR